MNAAVATNPSVIHALPGRLRVRLPEPAPQQGGLRSRLRSLPGVKSVRVNPLTGHALILFDPRVTNDQAILSIIGQLTTEPEPDRARVGGAPQVVPRSAWADSMHVVRDRDGAVRRARIPVAGMDRDPRVERRVVERLRHLPGVQHVHASALTGRVLVEFTEHEIDLEDLLSTVADVELPDVPEGDRPAHPLDPAPLIQSATRTTGAGLGLGLIAARRLVTADQPLPGASAASQVSGLISVLRSFPVMREGMRRLLGRNIADLVFSAAGVVSLALADSPIGLALNAVEGLRILTEVLARREAFRRLRDEMSDQATSEPGAIVRVESGQRTLQPATIIEGSGSAMGRDGALGSIGPGDDVAAGARLYGGPFLIELQGHEPFTPEPRPAPLAPSFYDRYLQAIGPASLAYAAVTGLVTRSLGRAFQALLLVNPRPALIGREAADASASARVLRAGVTVVGTRPGRVIRLPNVLILDSPSILTEDLELSNVLPLTDAYETSDILSWAAGVAVAARSPWSAALRQVNPEHSTAGRFHEQTASAMIGSLRYELTPVQAGDWDLLPPAAQLPDWGTGECPLLLRREGEQQPLAILTLRPRLRAGYRELVASCRRYGVEIGLIGRGSADTAESIARRSGVTPLGEQGAIELIHARQREGKFVAFVADNASAAAAFATCDLAIGLTDYRSRFPARADLLVHDLGSIAAIIEAGARRNAAVRDTVVVSTLANAFGAGVGFRGAPGVTNASLGTNIAGLSVIADGWLRLRGGARPRTISSQLADPHPERWGRHDIESVLETLRTTADGLTSAEAEARRQEAMPKTRPHPLRQALFEELTSPLTGILAVGAGISLVMSAPVDVAIILATIAANVAVGTWQERTAGRAAEALEEMSAPTAQVLRDGQVATLPADDVVPGDIVLLATGDQVVADARLLESHGLEVDEAALTGESLPVEKDAAGPAGERRMVLEGSDVTSGNGKAVVVAVGRQTMMGATAAALSLNGAQPSPLGERLSRLLKQFLPLGALSGALVAGIGILRGQSPLSQLGLGATLAVAAVPEGLPLLARVGEAAVARRLASQQTLTRRLAAVEALGRVDVACVDKTGTLTEGRLALQLIASGDEEAQLPGPLTDPLRHLLLAAGLASPAPDAPDVAAHPTDAAVVRAAQQAGLGDEIAAPRAAESPFEPTRSFHAVIVGDHLYVKGAPEMLVDRAARLRREDGDHQLDDAGRQRLLARADELAGQGLRVLMVAERVGAVGSPVSDPEDLTVLGFLGIRDPLRDGVQAAVRRCHAAGIRVIMLTGDHPETARAIGAEAGLLDGGEILSGSEIAALDDRELDRRLQQATVIARATPLDKVRIVESLQRSGRTVAMTGDGVNDAPALRLADVGVAMGRGTEVARQASDLVLATDDFASLVEALVEGRSFWRNIRRALSLLLGGNLGELGLMVGASVLGLVSPLSTRQVLAVNLITDVLPGLAVALQQPEHRQLAGLAREGTSALDQALRHDVMRRAISTAAPSLGAHLLALPLGLPQARAVAFASIVATQLAQTLDAGWVEGSLSLSVLGAVGASGAVLTAALTVPPLRTLLALALPTPTGLALIGAAALAGLLLSRLLSRGGLTVPGVIEPAPAVNMA